MSPLWGHSEVVADFVSYLTHGESYAPCEALGVIDNKGHLVGGLVFHNWQADYGTIEISGAGIDRRWLMRGVLHAVASYVWNRLGCQMVYFRVDPEAKHIRRICRAVGGVEHVIPRMRGRDKSEILIVVTEEAWRESKFAEVSDATRKTAKPDADGHGRGAAGAGRAGAEAQPVSSTGASAGRAATGTTRPASAR